MAMSDQLRALRARRGVSLREVAEAVGTSKAQVWEMETGKRTNPTLDMLRKIAGYYGVTVATLIEEEPEREPGRPLLTAAMQMTNEQIRLFDLALYSLLPPTAVQQPLQNP